MRTRPHRRTDPAALAALASFAALALAPVASAQDSTPFTGVRIAERSGDGQRLFVAAIDLCAAGIAVRGTRFDERGMTVPAWAQQTGVHVAVNGNFFTPGNFAELDGWHRGEGNGWGGPIHGYVAPVAFGPERVDIWHHAVELGAWQPAWANQIVSGHPTLVHEGQIVGNPGDHGLCVQRHPRTLIGLTEDMRTLVLAVVDGRDGARARGMSCEEAAGAMAFIGSRWAVNLDGGGSSTFWVRGRGVLNRPSDGSPRRVSNSIGIYARGNGAPAHCHTPDADCVQNPALRRCNGAVIETCHNGKIDRGDCAAFGVACDVIEGEPRCVDPRCVGGGRSVCVNDRLIGGCNAEGAWGEGDCGVFGATCREDDAGAFCVHYLCGGDPNAVNCRDEQTLVECERGQITETPCPEGTACRPSEDGPARCAGDEPDTGPLNPPSPDGGAEPHDGSIGPIDGARPDAERPEREHPEPHRPDASRQRPDAPETDDAGPADPNHDAAQPRGGHPDAEANPNSSGCTTRPGPTPLPLTLLLLAVPLLALRRLALRRLAPRRRPAR